MRHHGCGRGARFEFNIPDALFAGRGPRGNWGPFEWDFRDGGGARDGGSGRGGRGRRRMFEGGELRLVLLRLIADEPRHGYDLIRAIEDMTGGDYAPSPGVIYPTLTLLQDMGFIEEAPDQGPRKSFRATAEGRDHLAQHEEEVEGLLERLRGLAPSEENTAGPAIGRAIRNLMTALRHRVSRDGLDDDLLHEIAAILDDAAQRIERVK